MLLFVCEHINVQWMLRQRDTTDYLEMQCKKKNTISPHLLVIMYVIM